MERTGEAFELGDQLTVVGRQLAVGDAAPDFALEQFYPETQAIRQVSLADSAGKDGFTLSIALQEAGKQCEHVTWTCWASA